MTTSGYSTSRDSSGIIEAKSRWSSSTGGTQPSSNMLSINFSTPLAGAARAERIKQLSNHHPAFERSRESQGILVKIQTSLRRMPGVSSKESDEIIAQLREVGQIISSETSQLVDALMNLTIDQEETDKAMARMSIEANLAKASNEDQTHTLSNLRVELANEKGKRQEAEAEFAKVVDDLQNLTREFKSLKEMAMKKGEESGSDTAKSTQGDGGGDNMIKHLENTIKHLEDQVDNRQSLWIMKNSSPEPAARVFENCTDKVAAHKAIMSSNRDDPDPRRKAFPRFFEELPMQHQEQPRPASVFQANRGMPSVPPPRYGPPLRPSSAMPSDRRFGPRWGSPAPGNSRFGPPALNGPVNAPAFGRTPSRRGFSGGAYRPNAPEFYPQTLNPAGKGFNRSDSFNRPDGFNRSDSFNQRPDCYPPPPVPRGKYSRLRDPVGPDLSGPHSTALAHRLGNFAGPGIHVTEMAIAAWHDQIIELYTMIRNFVDHHANQPTFIKPTDLAQTRLWPVLMATYYPLSEPETISYLEYHLKDESSKSCLVTRVAVDYIVNRVWVPRAWAGADTDATYRLVEIEKEFEATQGQPSSVRQPILDRQAAIIDSILKLDHCHQFSKMRCDEISEMLLSMIQPLLNNSAIPSAAYRDLEVVAAAAWALSSRILSSRLTFDFRFPEVGTRFSCQSMVPIWPNMDSMELQAKHWRVALVTTPVVTCRNDTGSNISAHSVSLADVVCMQ